MKNLIRIAAFAVLAAAPVATAATAQTAPAAVNASPYDKAPWWMKTGVITQTGYVFTEVPANRATFSATFLSVDDNEDKAQAKAIEMTRALQQALAKLGKDNVRVTTSFSMRTLYEQYKDKNGNRIEDQRGDKINGYEVSLNIALEVRDMSVLEKAYALVLAASPTASQPIYFSLQPDNATNTWLYTQAVKDARTRALQAADAAGGKLGAIQLIDPTGRACATDILARDADTSPDYGSAQEVNYSNSDAIAGVVNMRSRSPVAAPPAPGTAEYLEDKALQNPFIQTPPLQRLTATACVVYGLN